MLVAFCRRLWLVLLLDGGLLCSGLVFYTGIWQSEWFFGQWLLLCLYRCPVVDGWFFGLDLGLVFSLPVPGSFECYCKYCLVFVLLLYFAPHI